MRVLFAQLWPGASDKMDGRTLLTMVDTLVAIKVGEHTLLGLGLLIGLLGLREIFGHGQRRLLIALAEELEARQQER
jgi:hypothetical protein